LYLLRCEEVVYGLIYWIIQMIMGGKVAAPTFPIDRFPTQKSSR